jgi:hypothetical protein
MDAAKQCEIQPVLMIPLRRCASHQFRLRLGLNPDFYSPYPLHIVDFMPLVPLYGDLGDDDAYFQLIVDVVGLQAVSMAKWDVVLDPIRIFDQIQGERRSVHRIVWEMMFEGARFRGARVCMDKSLDSVHYAEDLLALFPNMLFLNVVRDPRAQVSSMNRAIIHDFDTVLNAETWVRAYEAADRLIARYPQRVLTIRYEDFVDRQEPTLRKICRFLGIDFLEGMLDVVASAEAIQLAGMSALWENNAFGPIAANKDKFRKALSDDEIAMIETVAGRYMERYGYERLSRRAVAISATMREQAQERSDRDRARAWENLRSNDFRDWCLRMKRREYIVGTRRRLESAKRGIRTVVNA